VQASFAVAGVAVMADWVGSSTAFAYHNEPMPITTYWNSYALETARASEVGWPSVSALAWLERLI
jgi:hypothetical protein